MSDRKEFDLLVFIGRFQPFHNGHVEVVKKALEKTDKLLILIGSTNKPRTPKNPFSYKERSDIIMSWATDCGFEQNITTLPLEDNLYNDDLWIKSVQNKVDGLLRLTYFDQTLPALNVGLVGHKKDDSSYYLELFPKWGSVPVENFEGLDATSIRNVYFSSSVKEISNFLKPNGSENIFDFMRPCVPAHTLNFMDCFFNTCGYEYLVEEYNFIKEYKSAWEKTPYPPTFVTTDAIVVQAGHVLMVVRGAKPGYGLYALPGGFLEQNETILEGCLRELKEETKIRVPKAVLKGAITKQKVFDHPDRSQRGRTITHAFLMELPKDTELPKVRGSDDAKKAVWVPLNQLDESKIFEDHYQIIKNLIGG